VAKRARFTIVHGYAASLLLHSAVLLPVAAHALVTPPRVHSRLVVKLAGEVADRQTEEKTLAETVGAQPQQAEPLAPEQPAPPAVAPAAEPPPETTRRPNDLPEPAPRKPTPPVMASAAPPKASSAQAGLQDRTGENEQRTAKKLAASMSDAERLKAYVGRLTQKVDAALVYPEEARKARLQGIASVAFRILSDGSIQPGSLAIKASSGQPLLDESALTTVRTSAPFDPPPIEMTISIDVAFGPETDGRPR
jgi:periplasmic protein TonB